jgi:hypothetical protein
MSKKTKTNQQTTASYGWQTPPTTPDVTALQTEIDQGEQADPSIQYRAGMQKKALANSLSNPFGSNVSPETLEAIKYARGSDIDQQTGQAMREDSFRRKQSRFQKLYAKAGLTGPRLTQTGGTMQGSVSQPIWSDLLLGGITAAAGAGV